MKLSGSDDIRVALASNSRALNENTMSDNAQIVGDVAGRKCIIVSHCVLVDRSLLLTLVSQLEDSPLLRLMI
jgi:phosphoribosylpyrophosphate synthetase